MKKLKPEVTRTTSNDYIAGNGYQNNKQFIFEEEEKYFWVFRQIEHTFLAWPKIIIGQIHLLHQLQPE